MAICTIERLESRTLLASVPAGFTDLTVATGLPKATAMQFAPDGRLFIAQQTGELRVISAAGTLNPNNFMKLDVDSAGERGLLGIAFDPSFNTNKFVYIYYTAKTPTIHNRISRFTANGDTVVPGSEVMLLDLDNLSGATNHNGGALNFGPDGKLYAAVGENATPSNSQTLSNLLGKMLRINPDGTIPTDNPFYNSTTGRNRAIWNLGLRNPFTFAFQPGTNRIFINDVGGGGAPETVWEEINNGVKGANYGWPTTDDGTFNPASFPGMTPPIYAYNHTQGIAITGGAFYNPPAGNFPSQFQGDYFFADFGSGFIRNLEVSNNTAATFATGLNLPVDLKVGPEGSLYYLERGGTGRVGKIRNNAGTGGTGLSGQYFDNSNFTAPALTRTDPTVNFNFGSGSPNPSIAPDTFSIRWTGQVLAQYSQTYTFYTNSDDGVRLFVNNVQVINNFTNHAPTENSGSIALVAGQKYDIRLEYYENAGGAVIQLRWSSPSTPKTVIPQSQLFPTTPVAGAYTSIDIGSPSPAGSTNVITPNVAYDVSAGGSDIIGTSDQFRFVHRSITGDFDIKVRVQSLSNVDPWTKAGLMARSSLAANSANVFALVSPTQYRFTQRNTTGASTTAIGSGATSYPNTWLRLRRVGNTFTAFRSTNGATWTSYASTTLALPTTLFVGMAVTSHKQGTLATAQFRDLA